MPVQTAPSAEPNEASRRSARINSRWSMRWTSRPAHTTAAVSPLACRWAPCTLISTPFDARTGAPSAENRRHAYNSRRLTRLASRSGSIADVNAIIEKLGVRKKPIVSRGPVVSSTGSLEIAARADGADRSRFMGGKLASALAIGQTSYWCLDRCPALA